MGDQSYTKKYSGSCHCAAIQFTFNSRVIIDGMRCNCSVCERKGALLSNFVIAPEDFGIEVEGDALSVYQFGSNVAKHYFCKRCGIFTHVSTRLNPGYFRVNLGCIDGIDSLALPVTVYDGRSI